MMSLLLRLTLFLVGKLAVYYLIMQVRCWITFFNLLITILYVPVLNQLLSPCGAYGTSSGKGSSGKYGGKPYYNPMQPQAYTGTSAGIPGQTATRRGLGISAWGIVVVILALILGGMGFYYFSICYPILCKKERNYDMIQLHSVAV